MIASNFGSGGQYCHAIIPVPAPSPIGLKIRVDAVGQVDLPLSHADAARLISRAGPLGLGVWQFSSKQFTFAKNHAWVALRDEILREIWMNLSPYEEKPIFKLDKLILYGPGSQ